MGLALLLALGLWAIGGVPFLACFLIAVFAILVNGLLATWEDEQPGGFHNPTDQR